MPPPHDPERRVVVITGASSGIGRAAAVAFARRGDHVVLVARREAELRATLALCGGRGRIVVTDVSDRTQVAALAASVEREEGACDVLVNNAGIGNRVPFDGPAALDAFEHVLAVNLVGPTSVTAHMLALLQASSRSKRRAAVVNVSSVAGFIATGTSPAYCASKFGLTGLTESLHYALRPLGIHVANVQPGPVATEGWPHVRLAHHWLGRRATADVDAVARAIVRASDGHGSPARVIPRFYGCLLLIKVGAPPIYRAVLRRTARGRIR